MLQQYTVYLTKSLKERYLAIVADEEREEDSNDVEDDIAEERSFHEMKWTTQTDGTDDDRCQKHTSSW